LDYTYTTKRIYKPSNASRDEVEAIRDRNSSDKDVYIVGGHPVKIEVKLCGE